MNEKERKELAGLVADCKPCRGRIQAWLESHKAKAKAKAPKKASELTARGLVRLLGSLPKAAGGLVVFRAGHAWRGTGGSVEGTDGEAWANFKLKIKGEGEAIVNARELSRWLQVQSGLITLLVNAVGLNVNTDQHGCIFETSPDAHLPPAPKVPGANLGEMRAAALAVAIKSVAFSASDKEMRYAMNGIAFDGESLATTNGRSLAAVEMTGLKELGEKEKAAIFPLRQIKPLLAILWANGEAMAKVARAIRGKGALAGEYMRIGGPSALITVRAIDGRFPSWREVVPSQEPSAALELDARELSDGLLSLAALTPEDSEERAIKVSVDGAGVTLMHSNGRQETVEVKGKVKGRAGKSAAYINPAYMVDALKTVKGEVRLELRGSEEGVMLKAGSWQYLLMPVSPRESVNA